MTSDEYTYRNIILAVKALPKESELAKKHWYIYAPDALYERLKKEVGRFNSTITIHPFDTTFSHAMQRADMVVCRGGMTAIEAVAQGLPTLIIPRQYEYDGEQKTRAGALLNAAPKQVVCVGEKSIVIPSDLHSHFEKTLALSTNQRIHSTPPFTLNGHENAADAIIASFQDKDISAIEKPAVISR